MAKCARIANDSQLFMRALGNGSPIERDWILSYTIGEFYNEQSLFIQEQERKEAASKKAQASRKRK